MEEIYEEVRTPTATYRVHRLTLGQQKKVLRDPLIMVMGKLSEPLYQAAMVQAATKVQNGDRWQSIGTTAFDALDPDTYEELLLAHLKISQPQNPSSIATRRRFGVEALLQVLPNDAPTEVIAYLQTLLEDGTGDPLA